MEIKNETVVLAFRYKNHKEIVEKPENQRATEIILSNFLGYSCKIRCVQEDNPLIREAMKIGKHVKTEEK